MPRAQASVMNWQRMARARALAAASGAVWTPASLSGAATWWYGGGIVGATDGVGFTPLPDSQGGAYPLAQASGSQQPLYRATSANGYPCADFDGVNDGIGRTDMCGLVPNTARTLWAITQLKSLTARSPMIIQGFTGSADHLGIDANTSSTAGGKFGVFGGPTSTWDSDQATDLLWHLHVFTVTPTVGATVVSAMAYMIDGVTRALQGRVGPAAVWNSMAAWDGTVVGNFPGVSLPANARIAEAGIISGIIGAGDHAALRTYSRARYGTP
jgi:hypothetical protein